MSIQNTAVELVSDATDNIGIALGELDGDATAATILEQTCYINDQTNLSSAAISTVQKDQQNVQAALAAFRS